MAYSANGNIKKIIHIDMDCFYASIEIRENPSLKNKPVAVGGRSDQRGVLCTCNYIARQYGLHSAMPTIQAFKLCPDLILVPTNMPLYKEVSSQIHQIIHRYTSIIEPLSLDEAYLDVTNIDKCHGSATWIAQEIRQAIFDELSLTASAGVAPLKFLAKIASDYNKPNGQYVINPEMVNDFISTLPLKKIPGVGRVTADHLQKLGLTTCADIQKIPQYVLINSFGKIGQKIWLYSHGIDEREVQINRNRKSVGIEKTLLNNIYQIQQGLDIVDQLYDKLVIRINHSCPNIKLEQLQKIGIKLKFDDFQTTTLEKSGFHFSKENFHQLLMEIWQRRQSRSIRLIGLHINVPENKDLNQMSLW